MTRCAATSAAAGEAEDCNGARGRAEPRTPRNPEGWETTTYPLRAGPRGPRSSLRRQDRGGSHVCAPRRCDGANRRRQGRRTRHPRGAERAVGVEGEGGAGGVPQGRRPGGRTGEAAQTRPTSPAEFDAAAADAAALSAAGFQLKNVNASGTTRRLMRRSCSRSAISGHEQSESFGMIDITAIGDSGIETGWITVLR